MNNLKVFMNPEFGPIRIITKNNEPWFVGKDIATVLGYSNQSDALQKHVDSEDKDVIAIRDSIGRMQNTPVINESGLYSLILSSKLPGAKRFKRWVTSDVLPTIRKHGAYMTEDAMEKALQDPDFIIRLATDLKNERAARKQAEQQIEVQKPKVIFADAVSSSHTSILVGELAKILRGNNVDIGQKRLFKWLRENGFLIKHKGSDYNTPTQRAMEMGLFEIKEGSYINGNGVVIITKTPKITGKGQQYFVNKFLGSERHG